MKQERAKFAATVQVTKVTVTYADGHTETFDDDDARSFALKFEGQPNPISSTKMLEAEFQAKGINPLHLAPDATLAEAAKHGQADMHRSSTMTSEYSPDDFPKGTHAGLVTSVKIDYTITIERVLDS